jgi:hypothetical protein
MPASHVRAVAHPVWIAKWWAAPGELSYPRCARNAAGERPPRPLGGPGFPSSAAPHAAAAPRWPASVGRRGSEAGAAAEHRERVLLAERPQRVSASWAAHGTYGVAGDLDAGVGRVAPGGSLRLLSETPRRAWPTGRALDGDRRVDRAVNVAAPDPVHSFTHRWPAPPGPRRWSSASSAPARARAWPPRGRSTDPAPSPR